MKKRLSLLTLSLILAIALAACSGGASGDQSGGGTPAPAPSGGGEASSGPDASNPIKIGGLMAMTGGLASDGEDISNAINLAVENRNADGGVIGRTVEFVSEDAASTPDTAVNAAQKVLRDTSYDAVFGPHFSAQMLAIADLLNETQVVHMTGSQSVKVTEAVTNPYSTWFRIPDIYAGTTCATYFVDELHLKKIGIMAVNDDFGQSAKDQIVKYLDEKGVDYVVETYGNEDKDMTTQIMNLKNAGVDGIICWSYNDVYVVCARQLYELGMNNIPRMSNGAVTNPNSLERMESDWYADWYCITEWNPQDTSSASVDFNNAYVAKYNKNPNFLSASWYSATMYYLDAVEKAGSTDKDAVLAAMNSMTPYEALTGSWNRGGDDPRVMCRVMSVVQVTGDTKINTLKVYDFN